MKRPLPRIEHRVLLGLAATLAALGTACSPNNSVKPGAPVLTEITILDLFERVEPHHHHHHRARRNRLPTSDEGQRDVRPDRHPNLLAQQRQQLVPLCQK